MRIRLAGSHSALLLILLTFGVSAFKLTRPLSIAKRPRSSISRTTPTTAVDVLTHHNDNQRTGANLHEEQLNVSNVNAEQFGKLFSRSVDGYIYAQPLYANDVDVPGHGLRNVVYAATEHNSVYAFDADDSSAPNPLWQVNLGPPVPSSDLSPFYRDLIPEIGITGTPVIDKSSGTIYVIAKTKNVDDNSYHQFLHALDLSTGVEKFGGPVEITANIAGTGDGGVSGSVSFIPLLELNRPALLLLNGVIYIAFGSHGDMSPYHGWVLGYDASTLNQVTVHNTTPDGGDGAIWQGGQGLAADDAGNIYYISGNGTFDADQGGRDFGDSIVKLGTSGGLAILDWFTPHNQETLRPQKGSSSRAKRYGPRNAIDEDLGSGGPLLLPGTNLLIGCGKDGILRLLDTNNMGHFHSDYNADLQEFQATTWVFFGAPIFWNSPINGPQIYMWGAGDYLKAFKFVNDHFDTSPISQSTVQVYPGYSNSVPLSLSANESEAGSGIVWAACAFNGDANGQTVAGIVRAFDADDLSLELWNSKQNEPRDDIGNFAKFCPPTIANGKVYVATFSGQLHVFGLLPSISPSSAVFASAGGNGSVDVTAPVGIGWTAVSNNTRLIAITSGGSGSGNATVNYSVAANSGAARSGTMTIAGQTFTVNQEQGCTILLDHASKDFTSMGATDSIGVTASDASCSWNAVSGDAWITITSQSGSGNGTVDYSVAANNGVARTGTITISDRTFTVNQDAACNTLNCVANITTPNDQNQCGAVVHYDTPAGGGTCGAITCAPGSGSFFQKGVTTVTCTAASGPSCFFTVTVLDAQPPTIECPANVMTQAACGPAVVMYAPPVVGDNCSGVGAPVCSPPSGSTFPKGTTTIACNVTDSSANSSTCSFTATVLGDTQPPSFTNDTPIGINVAANYQCPYATSTQVGFANPTAVDNCAGVTVACNPPSGSNFPVGITVVTCTATDTSNNTASCSFPVTVYSACLVDEINTDRVVLFNATTGEYRYCCGGVVQASGKGVLTVTDCSLTIDHTKGDRTVHISVTSAGTGAAYIQRSKSQNCQISDKKLLGNTCSCP